MGKRRNSFIASDESGDERPVKVSKKTSKTSSSGDAAVDADGNVFWELANNNKRRVTVSKFGGRWLVSVREYYEDKTGEMKPGKKGISLSIEQYQALLGLVPSINEQLRKNGVALDDGAVESGTLDEAAKSSTKSKKAKAESKKANIEATSDEEEEEEDED
ncbi:hypothetical protein N0V93_000166 [Gnomoniopsis smithogilvyi]|uniref:Transcriptional coactivator p15 (PC4) C-terminal domain-containing protein n=1 Tax=Gnomoniopsis smithogilvyi TaxID=1191159 RepID=A0A9W8Z1S0_9PEZI|nr:hypothetical protein N0V93_000166 [Gnomoniopsis smithogilvyi]